MTFPRLRTLIRDSRGATLIEFTLVVTILLSVTFAVVEFALAMWQYNAATKAAYDGVRYAVQSDPVISEITDYNAVVDDGLSPGQSLDLNTLPAFTVRCTSGSCTCTSGNCSTIGGLTYDATAFDAIVAAVARHLAFVAPDTVADHVFVEYTHVGQGFAGRPGPDIVPLVTVGLTGLNYQFIAMQAFGLDQIPIAVGRMSLPAEDLSSTWP